MEDNLSACKFYNGSPVCCTITQDKGIGDDFESLDATFGSDGDGCDMYKYHLIIVVQQTWKDFGVHTLAIRDRGNFSK